MAECAVRLKRIMAALDLSGFSEATFLHALALAKALEGELEGELVLLNVINSRGLEALDQLAAEGYGFSREKYIETITSERKARFQSEYLSRAGEVPTELRFAVGLPYDEIIKAARVGEIDLIVMGTKGRSNLAGTLFGTTAEKVFRRAPCTVVSVRGPEHCRLT